MTPMMVVDINPSFQRKLERAGEGHGRYVSGGGGRPPGTFSVPDGCVRPAGCL